MKKLIVTLIVGSALSAFSQDTLPPSKFATAEAGEHIGETVTVCGVVSDSKYLQGTARSPTFLNFDKPFPHHTCTAIIMGNNRAKFGDAPETAYKGKRICVTGLVKLSHARPEIELTEASQLSVEADASAGAEPAKVETEPAAAETAPAEAK